MQLTHLEAFLCITDTGSISAASVRMHMSQPNISMLLRSLENEVGHSLIRRERGRHKQLILTDEGILFYEFAKNTLNAYDSFLIQAAKSFSQPEHPLKIITGQTLSVTLVASMIRVLRRQHPHLDVDVDVKPMSNMENIHAALESPSCDFVIATHPVSDPQYVSEKFFIDPFILICNHSLNIENVIPLDKLSSLPLVFREPTCDTMVTLTRSLQRNGLSTDKLQPALRVFGASAVKETVKNGSLCGFVPMTSCSPDDFNNFRVVNVKGFDGTRSIFLIYEKTISQSSEARLFRRFVLGNDWRNAVFHISP